MMLHKGAVTCLNLGMKIFGNYFSRLAGKLQNS